MRLNKRVEKDINMDDFQKATKKELKNRFIKLEERNEYLNELIEIDFKEIEQLKTLFTSANDRVKELEERCQSLSAHAVLDKERIEDLETWAREIIKEEKLYPYDYWPDCGKPYMYCGACGADLGKGKEHETSCSWLKASELGLV